METLFDLLQKDFCPPLDSSLIAALLVELESDVEGNTVSPSQDQIDNLYATCSALAQQSETSQQSDSEFSGSHILQISTSCTTSDYEQSSGSGSGSQSSSDLSQHSFGSPLGFLQTALPDVPTTTLRRALLHAKKENIDMWDIVADILTEKSILEMEEMGFDGLENREILKSKKKPSTKAGKKKIQSQSNKIILSDIRQQHHIRSSSTRTTNITSKRPAVGATSDPWTQISSLSTHIASLLPPHPPSFFQSFFHSPIYTTSYEALRAALTSLCKNKQDAANYTTIVSNIMDILLLDIEDHPELKARRTADIRLSVTVADGRATEALDLVNVLRDLDTRPDMGLSHLLPAQVSNSNGGVSPSELKPPSPTSGNKPSPDQWHIVRSSPTTRVHMPTKYLPLLENSKSGKIDLHGLYVQEAITHAERSIQLAKSNGQSQVELIVGKGRHSQGGIAKIKPAIKELLTEKHNIVAQSDPNNSGVLIAYLDSSNSQGTGPGYRSSQTRH